MEFCVAVFLGEYRRSRWNFVLLFLVVGGAIG